MPGDKVTPLHVQVVSYDWKWLFIYPELGIASVNRLVFPVSRPIRLDLTSKTVMTSFWVPSLGSQIYAMTHSITHLSLDAYKPGRFIGRNSQYNGGGFAKQTFVVRAVSDKEFQDWVSTSRAHALPFDARARAILNQAATGDDTAKILGVDPAEIRFDGVGPIPSRNCARRRRQSIVEQGRQAASAEGQSKNRKDQQETRRKQDKSTTTGPVDGGADNPQSGDKAPAAVTSEGPHP